uniref:TadE-like protein n=1 Tax=Eubacterium cellulosolvens (strain ATCC 43171 / JCM 9499 / 6) TaxID=633697 RepID=I5ATS1_EUBC6
MKTDRVVNGKKKRKAAAAFMTMEACVIVPLTVMMLALLLVLFFFVHNRNWYEMTAWECALTALNREEAGETGAVEKALIHGRTRTGEQPVPGSRPAVSVRAAGGEAAVSFSGQSYPMIQTGIFGGGTEVSLVLQRPAEKIRQAGTGKRKLFGG